MVPVEHELRAPSMKPLALLARCAVAVSMLVLPSARAQSPDAQAASAAINRLGLDLHRQMASSNANLCLSAYSLQNALAMTHAGADGKTRVEMGTALHYPKDEAALHGAFEALNRSLREIAERSAAMAEAGARHGDKGDPVAFNVANRLFGRKGFVFEAPFLALTRDRYGAPLEVLDFARDAEGARRHINGWVEDQTRKRIRDLIPPGAVDSGTPLVLANAVHLKAAWEREFQASATRPGRFLVRGGTAAMVPTMRQELPLGYARRDRHTVVTLPYSDPGLLFVVLLPDAPDGLAALEQALTPEALASCALLERRPVALHLPRFRMESASLPLRKPLVALGMKSAFDIPKGSADFGRMARGARHGELFVSEVFHKTFIAVDEKGTEAAAASAVVMAVSAAPSRPPKPVEVRVDRPFVFAVQHVPSGACLFLGHVVDPR